MSASEQAMRQALRSRLNNAQSTQTTNDEGAELRESLQERLNAVTRSSPERLRSVEQALRVGAAGFVANMLSLPHAAGELAADGAALIEGGFGSVIPGGRGFDLEARREENRELWPANMLLAMPDPTGEDVLDFATTVRKLPGELAETPLSPREAARRAGEAARAEELAKAEEMPVATTIGGVTADIASLLQLRPRGGWGKNLEDIPAEAKSLWRRFRGKGADEIPDVAADVAKAADESANTLLRGLGLAGRGSARAAEAGFEGALVAAMGEGDPVDGALWSAGIQAGGSMGLWTKSQIVKYPFRSFAGIWMGHEIFKAVAPGDQNALESKDEAIREMVAAYGVGIIAGLAGAKRGNSGERMGRVVDAISTASRAGIASVVSELTAAREENDPRPQLVVEQMIADPEYFGTEARLRIQRAAENGRLRATIESLMRNPAFRSRYDQIGGGEQ